MTPFFHSSGRYLGFQSGNNIFSRDSVYLGWREGNIVWKADGAFGGQVFVIGGRNYILKNQFMLQPISKVPKIPPVPPVPPLPVANVLPVLLPIGFSDVFKG